MRCLCTPKQLRGDFRHRHGPSHARTRTHSRSKAIGHRQKGDAHAETGTEQAISSPSQHMKHIRGTAMAGCLEQLRVAARRLCPALGGGGGLRSGRVPSNCFVGYGYAVGGGQLLFRVCLADRREAAFATYIEHLGTRPRYGLHIVLLSTKEIANKGT